MHATVHSRRWVLFCLSNLFAPCDVFVPVCIGNQNKPARPSGICSARRSEPCVRPVLFAASCTSEFCRNVQNVRTTRGLLSNVQNSLHTSRNSTRFVFAIDCFEWNARLTPSQKHLSNPVNQANKLAAHQAHNAK